MVLLLWLVSGVACAGLPIMGTPQERSAWGQVITVTQTTQLDAPALAVAQDRLLLAWVGHPNNQVHQDMVAFTTQQMTPIITLPLPPTLPQTQRLSVAYGQTAHLFWRDFDASGQTQLYNALVDETLGIFRGPIQLSVQPTECYDILPTFTGEAIVFWRSGHRAEPNLEASQVDVSGRVVWTETLVQGMGGCPAVAVGIEPPQLVWSVPTGEVMLAEYHDGRVESLRQVGEVPYRDATVYRYHLRVASEGGRLYLFWGVLLPSLQVETWFAVYDISGGQWQPARPLRVLPLLNTRFTTTFNSGDTLQAREPVTPEEGFQVGWSAPLVGDYGVVAVAGQLADGRIGVIYLKQGEVVGMQPLAQTEQAWLGAPSFVADSDRHLYLAWSQPISATATALKLTSTRQPLIAP
ncbi:MAG: hypothetical protein ACOYLB_15025 [Phototrophicaceae bacterium]